jgi:hypothetical protein
MAIISTGVKSDGFRVSSIVHTSHEVWDIIVASWVTMSVA